jgi:hypothetical protein
MNEICYIINKGSPNDKTLFLRSLLNKYGCYDQFFNDDLIYDLFEKFINE